MIDSFFKKKSEEEKSKELMIKQLDLRYAQVAIELERLKSLDKKIDRITERLKAIDSVIETEGVQIPSQTKSAKTIEAIKLILDKHGDMTSMDLSKLIKLSRTRCNEYLREMEDLGILVSKVNSRKKIYGIRQ
ncbi:MAG: winged helix-turn-helix transcriptional regulator [Candidatus Heimdallarchaeaceae archaeon]|jgi:DNA-binding Lrp family transcriptional regulator